MAAKLRANPKELEVLGDGKQSKNYLHVSDCVSGIIAAAKTVEKNKCVPYNIASEGRTSVNEIATEIIKAAGLKGVALRYTGKSWAGDVKTFELDAGKLRKTGWKPRFNSQQAVNKAVTEVTQRL